jgi:hypothetical protein
MMQAAVDRNSRYTMPQTRKERALVGQIDITIGQNWRLNAGEIGLTPVQ